jgi:hypothetical protein
MFGSMKSMPLLSALAMSVGWGFRGDYGHEAGAMVPGALLALAICLTARRQDWCYRASLLAMLGALGWAFGGQISYAQIVGYTMGSSFMDVAYGYGCLFVIGVLWSGIGAGILALGITRRRSELERFAGPLVALFIVWKGLDWSGATAWLEGHWHLYRTDWVAAMSALVVAGVFALAVPRARRACALIALLAAGWWLGFGLLTVLAGLHMTPPRSDNWAGCVGLLAALLFYLFRTRNRAALMLCSYGVLAGGIGFAVADFVNVLGRGQWGPVGRFEALHDLDYWKWMEQLFGLLMGLGVAFGFRHCVQGKLAVLVEDEPPGPLRFLAPFFLLVVMMWENLFKNVRTWALDKNIRDALFGIEPQEWFLVVGILLSACVVVALVRHRRRPLRLLPADSFGKAQLLFLLILWITVIAAFMQAFPKMHGKAVLLVHVTFWITAAICTLMVVTLPGPDREESRHALSAEDPSWLPGWKYALCWLAMPLLVLGLAALSVASHGEALPGSNVRFTP